MTNLPVITSPALAALPGLRHAFFTREGGVSTGVYASLNGGRGSDDDPAAVAENRRRMAATLGVGPDALIAPYQVHSADCVVARDPWSSGEAPKADAIASDAAGLAIAITIADCGPVLFADPRARVIGAAHAGWKGALTGVLEATAARMESLGARRADMIAALGPCIRQASYEVGGEFVARFAAADSGNRRFFAPAVRDGHALFDLGGYIVARLAQAGVGTIDDLGIDTYADEARLFSFRRATHRREADYGRLVAGIALV